MKDEGKWHAFDCTGRGGGYCTNPSCKVPKPHITRDEARMRAERSARAHDEGVPATTEPTERAGANVRGVEVCSECNYLPVLGEWHIVLCPLHAAAPRMVELLRRLVTLGTQVASKPSQAEREGASADAFDMIDREARVLLAEVERG